MKYTAAEKPVFRKIFRKRLLISLAAALILCLCIFLTASYFFSNYVKEKADKQAYRIADFIDTEAENHTDPETYQMSDEQYLRFLGAVDSWLMSCNSFPEMMIGDSFPRQAIRVFLGDKLIADSTDKPVFEVPGQGYFTCHPEIAGRFMEDNAKFRKEYAEKDTAVGFRVKKLYIGGRHCAPCITYIVTEYDSNTGKETEREIRTVEYYPENTAGMTLIEGEECDDVSAFNSVPDPQETDRCEKVMNAETERLLKGRDAYISDANTGETFTVRDIDYEYLEQLADHAADGVCFSMSTSSLGVGEGHRQHFRIVLGVENSLMHYYPRAVVFSAVGILLVALLIAYSSSKISYADRKAQYEITAARQETTRAMAHDLKTPMTSIAGYSELLQEDIDPEKKQHYLEMITQNVGQMNTIVSDILALSKAESGSLVLNTERLSVSEIFREIADSMSGAFTNAQLELRFNTEGDPSVEADRKLVTQALRNLLHNAAVYSKPDTKINAYLSRYALRISNVPKSMPTVSAEELVKPFVKGSSERGENSGSGVGLAIAKQNFERMGFGFSVKIENGEFTAEWQF